MVKCPLSVLRDSSIWKILTPTKFDYSSSQWVPPSGRSMILRPLSKEARHARDSLGERRQTVCTVPVHICFRHSYVDTISFYILVVKPHTCIRTYSIRISAVFYMYI